MVPSYAQVFTALCGLATTAVAVQPVIVDGKDFVNSVTKDRFQIIGVDYQPGGSSGFTGKSDPLSDATTCMRDAALMQRLGVNTIRIYNMSPDLNHDECASIFNAAGIYLILDVNSPLENGSLDRTAPWTSYNPIYMKQVFGMIEAFKNYPNTLALFSGNEVINQDSVEQVPAYVRAVQRDMHDYIAKHVNRSIPVGYSAADVRNILVDTSNYMSCNIKNSTSSRSDFFGLNSYSWCGKSSIKTAGYDVLADDFKNASLPVFFSEYGCNKVTPRVFTEVQAIYSEEMTQAISGGLVYEWTQEANNYGLVQINDNNTVTLRVDYDNLQKQFSQLDLKKVQSANSSQTSVDPVECSADLISTNGFPNTFDIPTRLDSIQKMIDNGVGSTNVGKLVPVKNTKITETVYDSNGKEITGIELNVLSNDQSNLPGSNTSGSSSGSSSSGSPTSSASGSAKTNAAGKPSASGMFSLAGTLSAMLLALVA
ncbi:1,3-beta-glucanosyltransferase Gel2 [Paecilomyces variotii No. 5]|uniref:1,3-beta-glucanosyltransferase n=1 Tax=Byssochlamys spectabilis (strain No. 5 / NBRC 109023) TaxID=1356009 RepID=V5GA00_BYSSN|nr:1,3-beta-glucanosyltransferase Gel2 [Paecilomyces variotii No. 5]